MHAIILSAGRGSRLLPLTTDLPKCLLPVGLSSVLNLQLDTLFRHDIKTATVVTGFNAHLVKEEIQARQTGPKVKTLYNPCLLYTSPSPRDQRGSRMPSSA